jgi:LmbE family N-acetylglucosaminyl deacetylase
MGEVTTPVSGYDTAILACFAHPDDETFRTGGVLAQVAGEGHRTALVCATRGEAGEIAEPDLASAETLSDVRERELRCAAAALGVSELIFLDYRDSGMEGTPENNDRRAFINAPEDEVVRKLVGIVRRLRPQALLTFDPSGGYGHPDHIAIHKHTLAAFVAAGDAEAYVEEGDAWQPQRLFYPVFLRSTFWPLREALRAMGADTSMFDRIDAKGMWWPEDNVDLELDVSAYVDAKWQALLCHRTQIGPEHPFRRAARDAVMGMMRTEHFALAMPSLGPGARVDRLLP